MTFLYLNSNQMGSGDLEFEERLLKIFLEKLADSNEKVDVIGY